MVVFGKKGKIPKIDKLGGLAHIVWKNKYIYRADLPSPTKTKFMVRKSNHFYLCLIYSIWNHTTFKNNKHAWYSKCKTRERWWCMPQSRETFDKNHNFFQKLHIFYWIWNHNTLKMYKHVGPIQNDIKIPKLGAFDMPPPQKKKGKFGGFCWKYLAKINKWKEPTYLT